MIHGHERDCNWSVRALSLFLVSSLTLSALGPGPPTPVFTRVAQARHRLPLRLLPRQRHGIVSFLTARGVGVLVYLEGSRGELVQGPVCVLGACVSPLGTPPRLFSSSRTFVRIGFTERNFRSFFQFCRSFNNWTFRFNRIKKRFSTARRTDNRLTFAGRDISAISSEKLGDIVGGIRMTW